MTRLMKMGCVILGVLAIATIAACSKQEHANQAEPQASNMPNMPAPAATLE